MGSIPVPVTSTQKAPHLWCFSFLCAGDRYISNPLARGQSSFFAVFCIVVFCCQFARIGFETLLRPLLWRPCKAEQIPVPVCRSGRCLRQLCRLVFLIALISSPGNIPLARSASNTHSKRRGASLFVFDEISHFFLYNNEIFLKCRVYT